MLLRVSLVIAYAAINSLGVILMRSALRDHSGGVDVVVRQASSDPRLWFGAVAYASSFTIWLGMLSLFSVSTIYPIALGLGYAATVILAAVALGEEISAIHALGIALIGAGLLALVTASAT